MEKLVVKVVSEQLVIEMDLLVVVGIHYLLHSNVIVVAKDPILMLGLRNFSPHIIFLDLLSDRSKIISHGNLLLICVLVVVGLIVVLDQLVSHLLLTSKESRLLSAASFSQLLDFKLTEGLKLVLFRLVFCNDLAHLKFLLLLELRELRVDLHLNHLSFLMHLFTEVSLHVREK